jgi:tripartite-type tricarboxylate transporter receptor subunit TctC
MKLPRRKFLHLAAGAAALPAVWRIARAQTYPSRSVRMIVPYGPDGPTDVFARLIAQKLTENLGQQFFVENIGGAGGNIGMGQGAKADPDGHTIVLVATPLVINPSLYGTCPLRSDQGLRPGHARRFHDDRPRDPPVSAGANDP